MVDRKYIRNHFAIVYNAIKARGQGDEQHVETVYWLDKDLRGLEDYQQSLRREHKIVSDEIGRIYRNSTYKEECEKTYEEEWPNPNTSYLDECKLKAEKLKEALTLLIIEITPIKDELEDLLLRIPNIPDPSIPGAYPHEFNTIQEEPVKETVAHESESILFKRDGQIFIGRRDKVHTYGEGVEIL